MNSISLLFFVSAVFVFTACSNAASGYGEKVELNWMTNFEAALAQAKESGKPLLMDFTGSDWCGWCIKLDNEVFSRQAFADYAEDNLVLLKLDFPRNKKIPEEVAEQNEALAQRFDVQGFPTIILISPEGEPVARTGYQPGGPEKYVAHLKSLLEQQT